MLEIPFARYIPGTTKLHGLNPGVKLLCLIIMLSTVLLARTWMDFTPIICIAALAVLIAEISSRMIIRDLWGFRLLYLVTFVLHCMLTSGEALIDLPLGIKITSEGIERGIFFSTKIALLAALLGPVMRTTHQSEWSNILDVTSSRNKILRRLLAPFSFTLGVAVRFLPLILHETERIRSAQVSRGFSYRGGLIKRVRSMRELMIPLFTATLDRVENITQAMQARGFRLGAQRTIYRPKRIGFMDLTALLLTATAALSVVIK